MQLNCLICQVSKKYPKLSHVKATYKFYQILFIYNLKIINVDVLPLKNFEKKSHIEK